MEIKIICLEQDGNYFGIGNTFDEAFSDIKEKADYLNVEDVFFYESNQVKVKQQIFKIDEN